MDDVTSWTFLACPLLLGGRWEKKKPSFDGLDDRCLDFGEVA
jgi:hypothetical protein